MLLKQKTHKLFYGKWPYKVSCRIIGAYLIRSYGDLGLEQPEIIRSPSIDTSNLIEFIKQAKEILRNNNIKRRITHHNIDFYVMSIDEFKSIQLKLKKYITSVSEPTNDDQLTILLENKKYTLCDRLPHDKYRYKITFKDMPFNIRNNLISWAEKYSIDDIYITRSTKNHFKSPKYHYGTHYFYVKDPKMITLITMAANGYVRRTDEFILRSSINTVS